MPLQIRRGLSGDLNATVTPSAGEPIYTTDTGKLYIGDGITTGNNLAPLNADIGLDGLADVEISSFSLADGDVLLYNGTTSLWANQPLSLSIFSDIELSLSPAQGEVIAYDGDFSSPTFGKYINKKISIGDLSDVSIGSPADGDTLIYNSTLGAWEPQAGGGGGGATDLDGLTDVVISTPLEGQTLIYNSFTNAFENQIYARGLSTTEYVYIGASAQIEAITSNVALTFSNNIGVYAGIEDNSFSTGTAKQCLTADGNGGLNWEQVLLENVASGTLVNAADDTAAASAGVPVGGIYRDGSILMVRVS